MPEPDPSRKPPRRVWLWTPYALLVLAVLAWSGWWVFAAHQIAARMDAAQANARKAGFELAWSGRHINGYPFRLDVTLDGARVAETSGWALAAETLKGEAFAYAPDHWVIVASKGVTLTRPGAGAVAVTGQALRASVVAQANGAPRISIEGLKLAFTPQPGAKTFAFSSAGNLGLHLRQAPGGAVELFVQVDQGQAAPSGLLGAVAQGKPVSLAWQATLSKAGEAHGADFPSAVRAWAAAGGALTVERATLTAGQTVVEAKGGPLSADREGYLSGALDLNLKRAPQLITILAAQALIDPQAADSAARVAQARQSTANAPMALTFQAGRTTLGPVAISPAPKLY